MRSMNNDTIKEELRKNGIKNTRAKSALLHILQKNQKPMDVNTLHQECEKITPVNLVTVYRTLQQFHEKKLVQEFVGKDNTSQYEYINQNTKAHPHFQCEKCNTVFCLGELDFDDALYFSNMADQRVYRVTPDGAEPQAITPEGKMRFADGVVDALPPI